MGEGIGRFIRSAADTPTFRSKMRSENFFENLSFAIFATFFSKS